MKSLDKNQISCYSLLKLFSNLEKKNEWINLKQLTVSLIFN